MMGGFNDAMSWWMLWGGLMMVLFWGGLFAAIYLVSGSIQTSRNSVSSRDLLRGSAEDIAGRRLAAGEIDGEEFDRIMGHLGG